MDGRVRTGDRVMNPVEANLAGAVDGTAYMR